MGGGCNAPLYGVGGCLYGVCYLVIIFMLI